MNLFAHCIILFHHTYLLGALLSSSTPFVRGLTFGHSRTFPLFLPNSSHNRPISGSALFLSEGIQDEWENDNDDDAGKFLELGKEISKPFGPLGLMVAGYDEEYLDLIIDACESAIAAQRGPNDIVPPPHLPVTILGKADLDRTFREVLSELDERDCVLPADGDELMLVSSSRQRTDSGNYLRYPLVLFSGFEIPLLKVRAFLKSISETGLVCITFEAYDCKSVY